MAMMNLDETISAFRCCTQVPPTCSKCPLTEMCKWNPSRDRCKNEVKLSVNHWLKAQEPRILTADEMKSWDKDVWVEYFGDDRIVVVDEHLAASMTEFAMSMKCDKVRFWTARPTMEQREAAPWK